MEIKAGCCGFPVAKKRSWRQFKLLEGQSSFCRFTDAGLEKLQELARRKPSYVLFNNVSMSEDAHRFLRLLTRSRP